MPPSDDARLVDLQTRLEREDPGFPRAMRSGRPAPPRRTRRTGPRWGLAVGAVLLGVGIVLPQGLLIAAGLVVLGMAAQLIDPDPADTTPPSPGRH
ncbi:DUF3040 domain-containing protein [Streptomyces sp. NPDC059720]|uniref:DUF3040 domain-containing protein n=1 Tax=Streptomyces sp. NPDC059720 TaxID=3346924 RepID=UPI003685760A